MSLFSFSTPLDIDIVLQDTDDRPTVDVKLDKNKREKCLLYLDGETVKGAVTIRPKDGKRLEHTGIKVQFVGTIGRIRQTHEPVAGSLMWDRVFRDVLRPKHEPRVSIIADRTSEPWRTTTPSHTTIRIQERGETIRIISRHQREATLLLTSNSIAAHARCGQRE